MLSLDPLSPYQRYLKSDHWRQTRLASNKVYGGRCAVCQKHDLNHHHLFYTNPPTNTRSHHVLPLCQACHEAYHNEAPNKGIHTGDPLPSQVVDIIREVFACVIKKRRLDNGEPKWLHVLKEREHTIVRAYREKEGVPKKNRKKWERDKFGNRD